jgi:hypothetical protein
MIRDIRTLRYLELGDRLVQRGKFKTAAAVYSRYADVCRATTLLGRARDCVRQDPVSALRDLAEVERIVGASGEGRRLSAEAYRSLGQAEIAEAFLKAC